MALALSLAAAVFFAVLLLGVLVRPRDAVSALAAGKPDAGAARPGVRARRRTTQRRAQRQRGPFAPRFGRRAS